MSQTSSDEKKYKRATIGVPISSTPINNIFRHHSISLSGIDTASSSSTDKKKGRLQISKKQRERLKNTKWLRKRSPTVNQSKDINNDRKNESKEMSYESFIEKHPKTKKRADKKGQKVVQLKDTDNDWSTELEELINESLTHSRKSIQKKHDDSSKYIKLFDIPRTPEKIRDAGYIESVCVSPIGRPFRTLDLISSKNNIVRQDKSRPINLPSVSLDIRNLKRTDENDTIFHHTSNLKTYPSAQTQMKKSLKQKFENFVLPAQSSTRTPNCFLNQFVKRFRGETSQLLSLSTTPYPVRVKSTNSSEESDFFDKSEISIPPGMVCELGYTSRDFPGWITCRISCDSEQEEQTDEREAKTRKRVKRKQKGKTVLRINTVYDQSDETDIEFETNNPNNKRITLAEFRRKQIAKKVVDNLCSISSHSDIE